MSDILVGFGLNGGGFGLNGGGFGGFGGDGINEWWKNESTMGNN